MHILPKNSWQNIEINSVSGDIYVRLYCLKETRKHDKLYTNNVTSIL